MVKPVTVSMGGWGDWASMDGGLVGPTWRGSEGDYSMGGVVRLVMVRVQGIRTEVEVRDTAQ